MDLFSRIEARQARDDAALLGRIAVTLHRKGVVTTIPQAITLATEVMLGVIKGSIIVGSFPDSVKPQGPWIDTSCMSVTSTKLILEVIEQYFDCPFTKSATNLEGWEPTSSTIITFRRIAL